MGLCSIAAHHLGAERVLATDGDVDVLENLRHNINLNVSDVDADGNNYSKTADDDLKTIACPQLVWGGGLQDFIEDYFQPEIIFGTDVLYNTRSLEPLWRTIDGLLTQI